MLKKLKRKIVYAMTEKPEHYVHVDTPKTLQDHRQVQYNNWCKRKGVYNGSYLPEDPQTLLRKGWTDKKDTGGKLGSQKYIRKSSGQKVMFHKEKVLESGMPEDKHYHWFNQNAKIANGKVDQETGMMTRYGEPCKAHSKPSHLAPLDKKYNYRSKEEWEKENKK